MSQNKPSPPPSVIAWTMLPFALREMSNSVMNQDPKLTHIPPEVMHEFVLAAQKVAHILELVLAGKPVTLVMLDRNQGVSVQGVSVQGVSVKGPTTPQ